MSTAEEKNTDERSAAEAVADFESLCIAATNRPAYEFLSALPVKTEAEVLEIGLLPTSVAAHAEPDVVVAEAPTGGPL